uniref:Uncharacterized protein n=1 Tax=Anguilla anguilla TaxID=7936 RepID=A0A0E9T8W7_ANGAN
MTLSKIGRIESFRSWRPGNLDFYFDGIL